MICELAKEAGFPAGVIQVLPGYGRIIGQAMAESMEIDKIAFTGSTATGRKIMEASSKSNLKPVTLELGGKSANIIFENADLDQGEEFSCLLLVYFFFFFFCAKGRPKVTNRVVPPIQPVLVPYCLSNFIRGPFSFSVPSCSHQLGNARLHLQRRTGLHLRISSSRPKLRLRQSNRSSQGQDCPNFRRYAL